MIVNKVAKGIVLVDKSTKKRIPVNFAPTCPHRPPPKPIPVNKKPLLSGFVNVYKHPIPHKLFVTSLVLRLFVESCSLPIFIFQVFFFLKTFCSSREKSLEMDHILVFLVLRVC